MSSIILLLLLIFSYLHSLSYFFKFTVYFIVFRFFKFCVYYIIFALVDVILCTCLCRCVDIVFVVSLGCLSSVSSPFFLTVPGSLTTPAWHMSSTPTSARYRHALKFSSFLGSGVQTRLLLLVYRHFPESAISPVSPRRLCFCLFHFPSLLKLIVLDH